MSDTPAETLPRDEPVVLLQAVMTRPQRRSQRARRERARKRADGATEKKGREAEQDHEQHGAGVGRRAKPPPGQRRTADRCGLTRARTSRIAEGARRAPRGGDDGELMPQERS